MMKFFHSVIGFTVLYEVFERVFHFAAPSNTAQLWALTICSATVVFIGLGLTCFWFRRVYIDELERKVQAYNALEKQVIRKRRSSSKESGHGH